MPRFASSIPAGRWEGASGDPGGCGGVAQGHPGASKRNAENDDARAKQEFVFTSRRRRKELERT